MRKILHKSGALCLLLMFIGSFVLHPLIHDSGCRAGSVRLDSCGQQAGRAIAQSEHKTALHAVDDFCPVCAGLLTAFCPENDPAPVSLGTTLREVTFGSARVFTPDWLKPSPRAPPAA